MRVKREERAKKRKESEGTPRRRMRRRSSAAAAYLISKSTSPSSFGFPSSSLYSSSWIWCSLSLSSLIRFPFFVLLIPLGWVFELARRDMATIVRDIMGVAGIYSYLFMYLTNPKPSLFDSWFILRFGYSLSFLMFSILLGE